MKKALLVFLLTIVCQLGYNQTLQLAPPQTESSRVFAKKGAVVGFDFRMAGAEIRYTTDGSEPGISSKLYAKPIKAKGLETIKAKAFKPGFLTSETTTVQMVRPGKIRIERISLSPEPKKYLANGWPTLCDGQLGNSDFQERWLGFDGKELELEVNFSKKKLVSQISIGLLRAQNAWIFLPETITVHDENGRQLSSTALMASDKQQPPSQETIILKLPKGKHKSLKIRINALPSLPEWHAGKGSTGWVFLDEILVW